MIDKHKVSQVKRQSVKAGIMVKPEVDVVKITMISDWRFKRGLMVRGGLSFSKIKPPILALKVHIWNN